MNSLDALWEAVEEIETALGIGHPVGETRVSVRAADLRAVLQIADGHLLFCNRIPNAKTRAAMRSANVTRFATVDEMFAAQGTEAQRAETVQQGSVHDGPVVADDAPTMGKSDQEGA